VLGLQHQHLKYRPWIERRPAAPAAIAITEPFDQPDPKYSKSTVRSKPRAARVLAQRFQPEDVNMMERSEFLTTMSESKL